MRPATPLFMFETVRLEFLDDVFLDRWTWGHSSVSQAGEEEAPLRDGSETFLSGPLLFVLVSCRSLPRPNTPPSPSPS